MVATDITRLRGGGGVGHEALLSPGPGQVDPGQPL